MVIGVRLLLPVVRVVGLDVVDRDEIIVYVYIVEVGLANLGIVVGVVYWDVGRRDRLR